MTITATALRAWLANPHRGERLALDAQDVEILASAMSAFGQDAERLEAKPASAVPKADAQ